MIDIHNHSLFGQDDGAKTIAEAMKMLAMAYESGTRTIVLTPHKNHPIEFNKTIDEDDAFCQLQTLAQENFPELSLLRGYEHYIAHMSPELINSLKIARMADTDFVLVEFAVSESLANMLSAIHEMRIAGLKPIVAHIEVYQSVNGNLKAVEALRNEGAVLQITGSSLIGKRGKSTALWLMTLIEKGLVDFVASDGHGIESRRPTLDKAKDHLVHKIGAESAEVLLVKNAKAVLDNMPVSYFNKNKQKFESKKTYRKKQSSRILVATMSLFVVGCVSAGVVMAVNPQMREQVSAYKDDVFGIQDVKANSSALTENKVQPVALQQESMPKETLSESNTVAVSESQTNLASTNGVTGSSDNKPAAGTSVPKVQANGAANSQSVVSKGATDSEDKLVEKYSAQLSALQGYYESKLKSQVIMAREELKGVGSKEERNKLYIKYADQITNLESQSDEEVQSVLYNLQTALEAEKCSIDSVKRARAEYAQIKEARRSYYTGLLKK